MSKKKKEKKKFKKMVESKLSFSKWNYIIFFSGIIVIAVGFYVLAKGSITLAPILLVLGYCVLIPISIMIK